MQQFSDWERAQGLALKEAEQRDSECVTCPKCSSQWFEELSIQRFQLNHHLILGQKVPPKQGSVPYQILKCIVCSNLIEPRIIHNTRSFLGDTYDNFLDTVEGKFDTREKDVDQVSTLQNRVKELEESLVKLTELVVIDDEATQKGAEKINQAAKSKKQKAEGSEAGEVQGKK